MMINDVDLVSSTTAKISTNTNNENKLRCVGFVDDVIDTTRHDSVDEVDFVPLSIIKHTTNSPKANGSPNTIDVNRSRLTWNDQIRSILKTDNVRKSNDTESENNNQSKNNSENKSSPQISPSIQFKNTIASSIERKLPKFPFHRKQSDPTNQQTSAVKERPKFVKCASIARLFGNTYSTQKSINAKDDLASSNKDSVSNVCVAANRICVERFRKCPETFVENGEIDQVTQNRVANGSGAGVEPVKQICDGKDVKEKDMGAKTLRTISKSLGRLWRRSRSIEISIPDPEFKVLYLGNVLTGWAKGKIVHNFTHFSFIISKLQISIMRENFKFYIDQKYLDNFY